MSTHLLVGLTLVVGAPAPRPTPPAPAPPSLVGEWKFEVVISDGQAEPMPGHALVFAADGTFLARQDGQHEGAGTYTCDPKSDPPEVDLLEQGSMGPLKGVWRLEGDTLTLCLSGDPKGRRPSAFAAPAGTDWVLVRLVRVERAAKKK